MTETTGQCKKCGFERGIDETDRLIQENNLFSARAKQGKKERKRWYMYNELIEKAFE